MAETFKNISDTIIIPKNCRERFLPLREPSLAPLAGRGVTLAGLSDLRPPYKIGRLAPAHHVVIVTLAGGGRWRTGAGGEGRFRPGQVWVAPAGKAHGYEAGASWRMLWFHLEPSGRWGAPARLEAAALHACRTGTRLVEAVEGLLDEADHAVDASPPSGIVSGYAELAGLLLERELGADFRSGATPRWGPRLELLRARILAAPERPWPVAELAAALHVSPVHLHRIFRRELGVTPSGWVTRLRMRLAAELLRATDYPLEVVAARVGYRTPFAFSRAFKRAAGTAPRSFRRGEPQELRRRPAGA